LKEECFKLFDQNFQNDMFSTEHEIKEKFESEFIDIIQLFINKFVFKQILLNVCPNLDQTEENTFSGIPDFVSVYYNTVIREYIEQDLLPAFHKKFTLPKEDEFTEYLQGIMPQYKKSGKKPEQRVIPFAINSEPYPELL